MKNLVPLVLMGLAATVACKQSPTSRMSESKPVLERSVAPAKRPVYPYSVVPGGIVSGDELRQAKKDPVVRDHYKLFDDLRAVRGTYSVARLAYVSYRKDNKIFWTAKKVQLKSGETYLTDGTYQIRTRCGNMVSNTPQQPVASEGEEPPEELFDNPILTDLEDDPVPASETEDLYGPFDPIAPNGDGVPTGTITKSAHLFPLWLETIPVLPFVAAPLVTDSPPTSVIPPVPIYPVIVAPPAVSPTMVVTPEPSAFPVMILSFGCLVWFLKRRKSC